MSDQLEADTRIAYTMSTDGWNDIKSVALGMIKEDMDFLVGAIGRRPETLTGKTAIKHAARLAAINDLMEILDDKVRLLQSKRKQ